MSKVTLIADDDSPLTQPQSIHVNYENAIEDIRHFPYRITRIQELATPDLDANVGVYVVRIYYESIPQGAYFEFVS